jgi:hypothetical protein
LDKSIKLELTLNFWDALLVRRHECKVIKGGSNEHNIFKNGIKRALQPTRHSNGFENLLPFLRS